MLSHAGDERGWGGYFNKKNGAGMLMVDKFFGEGLGEDLGVAFGEGDEDTGDADRGAGGT